MPERWVAVASTKDLVRRRKLRVEIDGHAVVLFDTGGRVFALDDLCVHQQRSLFKGTLLHGKVVCPGHQWQFDLQTGFEADQDRCQPTYPVRVEDETVYVDLTAQVVGAASPGEEARA